MSADLWMLLVAGTLIGGATAWLVQRRRPTAPLPPATDGRQSTSDLKTCEGIGPTRASEPD